MQVIENGDGESVFVEHSFTLNYHELKRWVMEITSNDRALSEDILHDAYLRFRDKAKPIGEISDPDGYLYVALRNTYRSYLKRESGKAGSTLSIIDTDLIVGEQLSEDPRSSIRTRDDLLMICDFACGRKTTSIAASLMILRFFHGYFPAEVTKVANRSRNSVDVRLMKVRREIAEILAPDRSASLNARRALGRNHSSRNRPDFFGELQQRIFESVEGSCFDVSDIKRIYKKGRGGPDRWELSHLVSCPLCLDKVNGLMRIPLLKDRHPLDALQMQTTLESMQLNISGSHRKGQGTGESRLPTR